MDMREILKDKVTWQIGRGNICRAFHEPWHYFWQQFTPNNRQQRCMMVGELINADTNSWASDKLISCFGFYGALYVATHFPTPGLNADRLVFLPAKNGIFTFKGAVQLLSGTSHLAERDRQTLKAIWYSANLLPRVRLFMWKLFHDAVPTTGTYVSKMNKPQVQWVLCNAGWDDGVHALFKCASARAFWFASGLGIQTAVLPDDARHLLHIMTTVLQDECFSSFANHLWALWKHRCAATHGGKIFRVESGLTLARGFDFLSTITSNYRARGPAGSSPVQNADTQIQRAFHCCIDGSFDDKGRGGWACVFRQDESLVRFGLGFGVCSSPFQSELQAMQLAIKILRDHQMQGCIFYTDCQLLCRLLNGENVLDAIPWQCFFQAQELTQVFRANHFSCVFINRDLNHEAHNLANYARRNRIDFQGTLLSDLQGL
ncbi:hypothetical protein LUZ61_017560 [Rhynchospora tenuis]|uniref:RNase H type-1 domain-containing protein n=1 Tax=Rhynchospora tenuis TaxID=198213 RepID=A0AAD6EL45_9POAL|nr:hypothetical protein LUZ61_017560 [Rhynchospora tenuis]